MHSTSDNVVNNKIQYRIDETTRQYKNLLRSANLNERRLLNLQGENVPENYQSKLAKKYATSDSFSDLEKQEIMQHAKIVSENFLKHLNTLNRYSQSYIDNKDGLISLNELIKTINANYRDSFLPISEVSKALDEDSETNTITIDAQNNEISSGSFDDNKVCIVDISNYHYYCAVKINENEAVVINTMAPSTPREKAKVKSLLETKLSQSSNKSKEIKISNIDNIHSNGKNNCSIHAITNGKLASYAVDLIKDNPQIPLEKIIKDARIGQAINHFADTKLRPFLLKQKNNPSISKNTIREEYNTMIGECKTIIKEKLELEKGKLRINTSNAQPLTEKEQIIESLKQYATKKIKENNLKDTTPEDVMYKQLETTDIPDERVEEIGVKSVLSGIIKDNRIKDTVDNINTMDLDKDQSIEFCKGVIDQNIKDRVKLQTSETKSSQVPPREIKKYIQPTTGPKQLEKNEAGNIMQQPTLHSASSTLQRINMPSLATTLQSTNTNKEEKINGISVSQLKEFYKEDLIEHFKDLGLVRSKHDPKAKQLLESCEELINGYIEELKKIDVSKPLNEEIELRDNYLEKINDKILKDLHQSSSSQIKLSNMNKGDESKSRTTYGIPHTIKSGSHLTDHPANRQKNKIQHTNGVY